MLYPDGSPNRPNVSSPFGPRKGGAFSIHYGADLTGFTTIRAVTAGKVTFAGWMNAAAGNTIIIDHGNGVSSVYMHNASHQVSRGDDVAEGTPIAAMGATGNATGRCCHLEIRIKGTSVDPLPYIAARITRPTGSATASQPPTTTNQEDDEMSDGVFICETPINGRDARDGVNRWICDSAPGTKRNIGYDEYKFYRDDLKLRELYLLQSPAITNRYTQL